MINMIKADCYRISKSIAMYIGIMIMLLMIGTSIYTVQPGSIGMVSVGDVSTMQTSGIETAFGNITLEEMQTMGISDFRAIMLKIEGYELDRDILAQNMNLYYVFIFVAALAIAADFSNSRIKNTLSSAISRNKYFASKLIFVTAVCLIIFFMNTYITYFANIIFNGSKLSAGIGNVTKASLMQLPAVLALISILNGLAFMLKKPSLFNTVVIPFVMVFQLLLSLAVKLFNINEKYIDYELQIMLGKLAYDPSVSYTVHSYIVCAVIITVFTLLGYLSFRKAEIK